jgi:hypothetical protein
MTLLIMNEVFCLDTSQTSLNLGIFKHFIQDNFNFLVRAFHVHIYTNKY